MAHKRSAVVLLLACGLFAEAQIAAPTAEPAEDTEAPTEAPEDTDVVNQISAPTEAPEETDDANQISAPAEEPNEPNVAEAPAELPEESPASGAVKRALSAVPTQEQLLAGKVDLCIIEAEAQLAELLKESSNFSYKNETGWVYAPLSGEFEVPDGLTECKLLCEHDLLCQRWVYMCASGRGLCKLHSHGGMETEEPHTYVGKAIDFESRYEAAENSRKADIAREEKKREDAMRQELQEIDDAKKNAVGNAIEKMKHAQKKYAGDDGGGRRLDTAHQADDEDIFGEGEL